jgi:hypothetical protein
VLRLTLSWAGLHVSGDTNAEGLASGAFRKIEKASSVGTVFPGPLVWFPLEPAAAVAARVKQTAGRVKRNFMGRT